MRLTCPNCGAEYEVPDGMVPAGGRHVQCTACHTRWFVRGAAARRPERGPDHPPPRDLVRRGRRPVPGPRSRAGGRPSRPPPAAPAAGRRSRRGRPPSRRSPEPTARRRARAAEPAAEPRPLTPRPPPRRAGAAGRRSRAARVGRARRGRALAPAPRRRRPRPAARPLRSRPLSPRAAPPIAAAVPQPLRPRARASARWSAGARRLAAYLRGDAIAGAAAVRYGRRRCDAFAGRWWTSHLRESAAPARSAASRQADAGSEPVEQPAQVVELELAAAPARRRGGGSRRGAPAPAPPLSASGSMLLVGADAAARADRPAERVAAVLGRGLRRRPAPARRSPGSRPGAGPRPSARMPSRRLSIASAWRSSAPAVSPSRSPSRASPMLRSASRSASRAASPAAPGRPRCSSSISWRSASCRSASDCVAAARRRPLALGLALPPGPRPAGRPPAARNSRCSCWKLSSASPCCSRSASARPCIDCWPWPPSPWPWPPSGPSSSACSRASAAASRAAPRPRPCAPARDSSWMRSISSWIWSWVIVWPGGISACCISPRSIASRAICSM